MPKPIPPKAPYISKSRKQEIEHAQEISMGLRRSEYMWTDGHGFQYHKAKTSVTEVCFECRSQIPPKTVVYALSRHNREVIYWAHRACLETVARRLLLITHTEKSSLYKKTKQFLGVR